MVGTWKLPTLRAVGNPADVVDGSVVAVRHLLGIFDDLVDEVAEVQHEAEPLIGGRALVLPDHAAIRVLRALVDALARDEGEADRARIVSVGAVMVRPMRLPSPSLSMKRYQ